MNSYLLLQLASGPFARASGALERAGSPAAPGAGGRPGAQARTGVAGALASDHGAPAAPRDGRRLMPPQRAAGRARPGWVSARTKSSSCRVVQHSKAMQYCS